MYIFDSFKRPIHIDDANFVEQVLKLKYSSGTSPWPVIEMCFNYWASKNPKRYRSFLISIKDIKETRKDPKFGSTYDKESGGYLRYTLDIPEEVMYMIRKIYSVDELPMDREFFTEFGKRFPKFKIAEKT